MTYEEARQAVYENKKVRRPIWPAHCYMALSIHERPHVFEAPGKTVEDAFSCPIDKLASDWELIEE